MRTAHVEALGLVPVRIALASSMITHGKDKVTSEGSEKAGQMFEQLGIHPGRFWARAAGWTELGAGVLSLFGIGTRLAALGVLVTQSVAVVKVHLPKGFPITKGGFEFNLALMADALELLITGPGKLSAHAVAKKRLRRKAMNPLARIRGNRRPRLALRALEVLK